MSELPILSEIAQALNGSVDVRDALDAVLTRVAEHFGLTTGWVWVIDEAGDFELAASRRLPEGLADDPQWVRGSCWCQKKFCAGELVAHNVDVITCSRLDSLQSGAEGFRYHASVPLIADDARLGILNLASRDWRELDDDELRLLSTVSDMLAVALQRARLYERSQELGALAERARLSREIHDGVAQKLTALTMRLEALQARSDEPVDGLSQALELARSSLADTRAAVMDLRDSPFARGTLRDGLERLVRESSLNVSLEVLVAVEPALAVRHALCRLVQEALSNVSRHGQTGAAAVRVDEEDRRLVVTVRDEGVGFDPQAEAGFGILGMRERARLIGAAFDLRSAPGDGTTIRVEVER